MKKQLVWTNKQKVSTWETEQSRTVKKVQGFCDAFRAMNIGELTTEEMYAAIQNPTEFYESRLMSLVDIPEASGPFKIDPRKYLATLEKPDTDDLMAAHADIISDHVSRVNYRDTLLEGWTVIVNPLLRDKVIETVSLYAETSQQVQAWEKHQAFTDAFNEYNEFLAEKGLARPADLHKLWDINSLFTWVPGDSSYVPNFEHFREIKRRSLNKIPLA